MELDPDVKVRQGVKMINDQKFRIILSIVFLLNLLTPLATEARRRRNLPPKQRSTSYKRPDKFDFPEDKFGELKSLKTDETDYSKDYTPTWSLGKREKRKFRSQLYQEAKKTCKDQDNKAKTKKSRFSWKKAAVAEANSTKSELGCDYTQADCVAKACVIAADEFQVDPHLLFCVLRRETYVGTQFHPKASQGGGNGLAQFTPPAFNEVMDNLFTSKGGPQEDSSTYQSFINYFRSVNETKLNLATGAANFSFHSGGKDGKRFPYVNFCDPVQSIGAAAAYLSILGAGPKLTASQSARFARRYNGNPKGGIQWAYGNFVNKCSNASMKNSDFKDLIRSKDTLAVKEPLTPISNPMQGAK